MEWGFPIISKRNFREEKTAVLVKVEDEVWRTVIIERNSLINDQRW